MKLRIINKCHFLSPTVTTLSVGIWCWFYAGHFYTMIIHWVFDWYFVTIQELASFSHVCHCNEMWRSKEIGHPGSVLEAGSRYTYLERSRSQPTYVLKGFISFPCEIAVKISFGLGLRQEKCSWISGNLRKGWAFKTSEKALWQMSWTCHIQNLEMCEEGLDHFKAVNIIEWSCLNFSKCLSSTPYEHFYGYVELASQWEVVV